MNKNILGIFLAALVTHASSKVLFVDAMATGSADGITWGNAYTDLQIAMNAANANDTLYVKEGTYVSMQESGFVIPRNIHLFGGFAGSEKHYSERPLEDLDNNGQVDLWELAHPTIIDANRNQHGAKLLSNSTFNGFTVTNAASSGILVNEVSRITQCQITHNSAKNGAGIYATNSDEYNSILIQHNRICYNSTELGNNGSGIYAYMNVKIENNEICHNGARNSTGGGVILKGQSGSYNGTPWNKAPILTHNRIHSNTAWEGGGVYIHGLGETNQFNVIFNNQAKNGGGVYFLCGALTYYPSAINNLVYNNSADSGGGVFTRSCQDLNTAPYLLNNTIVANDAIKGSGVYLESGTLINNLIWGYLQNPVWITYSTAPKKYDYNAQNGSLTRSGIVSNSTKLSSINIGDATSPYFRKPTSFSGATIDPVQMAELMASDWRLDSPSKAIDIGVSARVNYATDLDKAHRIVYKSVDVGAYEFDNRDDLTPIFNDHEFYYGDTFGLLTWSHNGPETLPVTFSGAATMRRKDTILLNSSTFTLPVTLSFAGDMLYKPFNKTANVTVKKAPTTVTVRTLDVFAEIGTSFSSYLFECEGLVGDDQCEELLKPTYFYSKGGQMTALPGTYEIDFTKPEALKNYESYQYIPGTLTRLNGPLNLDLKSTKIHPSTTLQRVDLLGRIQIP